MAEFHIISNFESTSITLNEHLSFAYIEIKQGNRVLSCRLHNGQVMHRGCNVYKDNDKNTVKTVMDGEIIDSYLDGVDTIYILQVQGGGKYWDGYNNDEAEDDFEYCITNWNTEEFKDQGGCE